MKSVALGLSALALASVAGAAAAQTQVNVSETAPVLSLSVSESVDAAPDVATVGAGVQTRAPTAKDAMAQNAAQMQKVIARIKKAGVPDKDIQTTGISLNAQYDYNGRNADGTQSPPRFIGYEVNNQVSVRSRDIKGLGGLLDALVESGANNINGPNFSIDNSDALMTQAREKALKTAQERALFYARQTGYSNVRLISISEGGDRGGPVPVMVRFEAKDAAAATPVAPGQVSTGVNLTIQYALVK